MGSEPVRPDGIQLNSQQDDVCGERFDLVDGMVFEDFVWDVEGAAIPIWSVKDVPLLPYVDCNCSLD